MKIPKLILSRPKLIVDIQCPKCKSRDIIALKDVDVTCTNCKTNFKTETKINIYSSIAKKLEQLLGKYNEVWILGQRDSSTIFYTDNVLKPRSLFEDEIWHSMIAIRNIKKNQRCWGVSEIENAYDKDYKIYCKDCGTCMNCITCVKCNKKYIPKEVKTIRGREKRYKCPECGNKNYRKTRIDKIKREKNKIICPYCNSDYIKKTKFTSDKKNCPRCNSTNITSPRDIPVYKLIIKRQRRFLLAEYGRK